jgi:hypothetical protein
MISPSTRAADWPHQSSYWTDNASMPLGEWQYYGFIFDGRRYPAPDPSLYLSFTFFPTRVVRLYWKRSDEDFFCERLASYKIDKNVIIQKIIWVNPKNHQTCGNDPDMQMGRETENELRWDNEKMMLYLELSGKPLIYLLQRVP